MVLKHIDIKGVRDADPNLRFRKGKVALPTRRTPKVPFLVIVLEHVKNSKDRVFTPAAGAIPYPVKGWDKPLTEKTLGKPDGPK